jgi:hypothetical protein
MVLLAVLRKKEEEEQKVKVKQWKKKQLQEKEEGEEDKKLKKNRIAVAALLVIVAIVGTFSATTIIQSSEAFIDPATDLRQPKAPMAVSQDGNNVYVVWWTNRSGNWEVMFRASTDGGQTFGDKINLSNSPDTQSQTAEIIAFGNNVFVTWWELNEIVHPHTNESVLRVSNDAGQTFGPVINLGTNGTITTGGNSTTGATPN